MTARYIPGLDASRLTLGVPNALWSESMDHSLLAQNQQCVVEGSEAKKEERWPKGFLHRYRVESMIGNGASSEVFSARSLVNGEAVAVKRVFKRRCCVGTRATRRLRDEVRVLSKLRHPHIIEMRQVWETPTELYIVMERAFGGELFDRIVKFGNFSENEAKIIMRQLLSALSEMHKNGFIHRDVKPENLLLITPTGWDIKLSDFGLVKTLEDEEEQFLLNNNNNNDTTTVKTETMLGGVAVYPAPIQDQALNSISLSPEPSKGTPQKRQRRPSWGETLETVDEISQYCPEDQPPRLSEDTAETDVQYYYSTAGVDVKLSGGPIVAEVAQNMQYLNNNVHTLLAVPPPQQKSHTNHLFKRKSTSYRLSEEEAFALLPALSHTSGSSAERNIAHLFHRARTHTLCGSQFYMAPEVSSRQKYGPAVDVWSAGVVMYILLTGSPPWDRPPQFGVIPELDIHGVLAEVSNLGVDLLLQMLRGIPEERCTAAEALSHPWLASIDEHYEQRGLSPNFESAIRNFCEKRKRGAPSTNLDHTPVHSNFVHTTPPTASTVDLKRNRQHSILSGSTSLAPKLRLGDTHHSISQHSEYDTFSSEHGSDDDDNDPELSPFADLHLSRPPYNSFIGHQQELHVPFRLSLDSESLQNQQKRNATHP